MINSAAIAKFLARRISGFDWMKQLGLKALDDELAALQPKPDFAGVKLWLHQKVCLLLLLELKRFLLFVDMGGGKTLLILMLLKYRKQRGETPRAIVFVPYITSVDTWVEETAKHAPTLKCVALLGTTAQNLAALGEDADLFVICYQSAVAMLSSPIPSKKGKKKWQINPAQIRALFSQFDTLVCDEIHRCKSHSSLTYKMCRAISAQCEYMLGLTGTPFGRDLSDLWPQFYLVDFGDTLGPTLGFYRSVFFKETRNYWGGYEHTFKQKMLPDLQRVMKNISISYSVDEFADMPPKEYIRKYLSAPEDSKGYCEKALADLNSAIKEKKFQAVNSSYLQLRQLSSGYITFRGEDSDRIQVQFDQNPKLDLLMELIENMPHGTKAVVFHHFVYTNNMISDRLKAAKIKHARIWGGQKDPIGELRKFKTDPDCTILVINWKSGSSSLNLQGANYFFVFEQPETPIDRKQGEARVWRPGQLNRVFVYDLLVRGTVDIRLMKANEAGKNLLQELLNGG